MDSCGHSILLHSGSSKLLDPVRVRFGLLGEYGLWAGHEKAGMINVESSRNGGATVTIDPMLGPIEDVKERVGSVVLDLDIGWMFVIPAQPFEARPLTATIHERQLALEAARI